MYTPLNSFIINVIMRWPAVAGIVAVCGACYVYIRKA